MVLEGIVLTHIITIIVLFLNLFYFYPKQEIKSQKRQLKYDALLQSLTLIDALFSNIIELTEEQKDKWGTIKKQYSTVEEARKCHSNLILTCDNYNIVKMFSKIMLLNKNTFENPTDLLNEYRNIVRKELGFWNKIELDREIALFANIPFEKES